MKEIEFIKSMETLNIEDGDMLVFRVDRILPDKVHCDIKSFVKKCLPEKMKDVSVFILEPGCDLGVMRKEVIDVTEPGDDMYYCLITEC